jgi:YD repeat-containing protein
MLVVGADSITTLTTPDQFAYRFGSQGRLASITDRNGNATTLDWTDSGLTVTEATGRQFVLTCGTGIDFGHFVRLTEVGILDRWVGYTYNPATGDLTQVRDVRGGTIALLSDGAHRVLTLTDQVGNTVLSNHWSPTTGRITGQDDANTVAGEDVVDGEQPFTLDYSTFGQTVVTDRRDHNTTYYYDMAYRLTGIKDAKATIPPLQLSWDNRNDLRCVTDRKNNRTGYRYDARGNVERVVPPKVADAACEPTAGHDDEVYAFTYTARNDIETVTYPSVLVLGVAYRRHYTYHYND